MKPSKIALPGNESLSIKNGIMAILASNVPNSYYALFAISVLGATNHQVALLNSLPQLAGIIAMIPALLLFQQSKNKKAILSWAVFLSRIALVAMVLIPISSSYAAWAFVLIVAVMNLPGSFTLVGWQAFISDLIPENRRAVFFSYRNKMTTIAGMVSTLVAGICLQPFAKDNPVPFKVMFALAFLFGLLEIYYLNRHKEPEPIKEEQKKPEWNLRIFKNRPYLTFLATGLFFNFAWQMAWPLFSIYAIKEAHATALWVSLFTVANQLAQIISYNWWGRQSEKHGNNRMLFFAGIGMAMSPILTIMSPNLYYQIVVNIITGLFVSGTVTLLFNELLHVSKGEKKTQYIVSYNFLLAIVAFIAPQFGVWLLETINMSFAMNSSTILRLAAAFMFYYAWRSQHNRVRMTYEKTV